MRDKTYDIEYQRKIFFIHIFRNCIYYNIISIYPIKLKRIEKIFLSLY